MQLSVLETTLLFLSFIHAASLAWTMWIVMTQYESRLAKVLVGWFIVSVLIYVCGFVVLYIQYM